MLAEQVLAGVAAVYAVVTVAGAVMFLWLRGGMPSNLLSWFLLVEGVGHLGVATLVVQLAPEGSPLAWAGIALVWPGMILSTVLYLLFIGAAIDVPLTRPLRGRSAWIVLGGGGGLWAFLPFAAAVPLDGQNPVPFLVLYGFVCLAATYGLAVAIQLLSRAADDAERRRSRAYLAAFGLRDLALLVVYGSSFRFLLGIDWARAETSWIWTFGVGFIGSQVLFVLILAYGALSGQIIELDRKVHLTVSRATIAATFIAVFVAVQTIVSEFAADTWGLVGGGLAAAALFIVLGPLQRMAVGLADRAAPQGRESSRMSRAERERFYKEQLQIAYSDGVIGRKERTALASVRERLNIPGDVALSLEDEVVRAT